MDKPPQSNDAVFQNKPTWFTSPQPLSHGRGALIRHILLPLAKLERGPGGLSGNSGKGMGTGI